MKTTLRVLLCAGVAAALSASATPASAEAVPCWKITMTRHQVLNGPPGPDVWVNVPTIDLTNCL